MRSYAGSSVVEFLRARSSAITAGIVVAAPIDTSVSPSARRRGSGTLLESNNPMPAPSAALVATMKANVGLLSSKVFMITAGEAIATPAARDMHRPSPSRTHDGSDGGRYSHRHRSRMGRRHDLRPARGRHQRHHGSAAQARRDHP